MAGVKTTSKLAAKYGNKLDTAVKEHAKDDTTYGIINLPPGITNGIARISKCYFKEFVADTNMKKADGTSAKGEFFFRAEGTVISPTSIPTPDGIVPVKGLTTSVMIPLCDQKQGQGANETVITQDMQVSKVLNIMRQLAGVDYTKDATGADLEALAAGIEEAHPYFRFTTSASKPKNPGDTVRTFENWHGNKGLEDYVEEETQAFNDSSSTQKVQSQSPPVTKDQATAKANPKQQEKVTSPQELEERVDAIVPLEEWSLDDLVAMAESDADQAGDARQRLSELAQEAGYTLEEIESESIGWPEVKEMIENPKQNEDENQSQAPTLGETCKYSPPNKKKPGTNLSERDCQILAVDEENQTVDLKDLTTKPPAVYKAVAWANIS